VTHLIVRRFWRDLIGERVFINPPWELAEQIGRHFENCRRTTPTSTMNVLVLPKWAKFNELTRHWKLYQEFPARTQLLTRQSPDDRTRQEVVALTPWHVQQWLVDDDCTFYDKGPTATLDDPTSRRHGRVHRYDETISPKAAAPLTDPTEARPLIRIELTVKTPNGGQLISRLVDCAPTLDFHVRILRKTL
jgi:hypothetical protein